MKALVYHGPGDKRWQEVPDPELREQCCDPLELVECEQRRTRLELEVAGETLGHAVAAAVVAAIGHRHAQVSNPPSKLIE